MASSAFRNSDNSTWRRSSIAATTSGRASARQLSANLNEMRTEAVSDLDRMWITAMRDIAFSESDGNGKYARIRRVGGDGFEPPTPAL